MAPAAPDSTGEDPMACDETPSSESTQAFAPQMPDGESAAAPIVVAAERDATRKPKRSSGAHPKVDRESETTTKLPEPHDAQPIEELRRMLLRLLEDHDEE